jgi:multimeric flavodoxin WrbA
VCLSFVSEFAGIFVSTGTLGGGQESTNIAMMSTFSHHGIIYVPLEHANSFKHLTSMARFMVVALGARAPLPASTARVNPLLWRGKSPPYKERHFMKPSLRLGFRGVWGQELMVAGTAQAAGGLL